MRFAWNLLCFICLVIYDRILAAVERQLRLGK